MSAVLFYLPFAVAAKPTNIGAPGAKAYFYVAGSTTLRPVYSTSGLTSQLSNPVIADGLGRFPAIYLNNALSYKLVIKDKLGTTLFTRDPYVPGTAPDAGSLAPYQAAAEAAAADAEASAASAADDIAEAVASTLLTVQGYVASAAASALAAEAVFDGTAGIVALPRFTPEMYANAKPSGVLGDGTDDGPALNAMSVAVSATGGAVDFYPGRTYWVGSQTLHGATPVGTYTYAPTTVYPINIDGCPGSVTINGNGAKIKCLAGKKYGVFNDDGTVLASVNPYTGPGASTPYFAMIRVNECSGSFSLADIELDGNIAAQTIGGEYDTAGRQLPMTGLVLTDNTGSIYIAPTVYSHHHGEDGGASDGPGLLNVREDAKVYGRYVNNGRNNWSHTGGNGWLFDGIFNEAGKDIGSMPPSGPGAGLDIEAEGGKHAVNTTCRGEYSDNYGVAILVPDDAAGSFNVIIESATLIGTTAYSAWLGRPGVVCYDTTFVGGLVVWGDLVGGANKFYRCTFTDDQDLTPGNVASSTAGILAQWDTTGLYFEDCYLERTLDSNLILGGHPNTFGDQTFHWHNCRFKADFGGRMQPYGVFSGDRTYIENSIVAPANWADDPVLGGFANSGWSYDSFLWGDPLAGYAMARHPASATPSGKLIYRGSATYNPPSLAAGAKDTIHTMTVTGVALGDKVTQTSFSVNLAGARIFAWVSAANTVSYYAINENGANPLDLASGTLRVVVEQA